MKLSPREHTKGLEHGKDLSDLSRCVGFAPSIWQFPKTEDSARELRDISLGYSGPLRSAKLLQEKAGIKQKK